MGIPCNASNKLTLEMAGEPRTLVEEFKEKGYGFDPGTWTRYEEYREERAMNCAAEDLQSYRRTGVQVKQLERSRKTEQKCNM